MGGPLEALAKESLPHLNLPTHSLELLAEENVLLSPSRGPLNPLTKETQPNPTQTLGRPLLSKIFSNFLPRAL